MEIDWKAETFDPTKPDRGFSVAEILEAVCRRHRVCVSDIASRGKTLPIVEARTEFCGVARELTSASYPKIGLSIGTKHSTVQHARARWMKLDAPTRDAITVTVRSIALSRHGRAS